ncbi:hypothetical protein ACHAW5_003206 [Stephanodiscus triporus]|uniref:EF-hand domain-containing protein n=1 Tax=Stephanodiscus triporus TaxID=2934178 RepID=A0ABD3PBM2_9STRA
MRRPNATNRILPGDEGGDDSDDDDDDDGRPPTVYEEDEADSFGERRLPIDDPASRPPIEPFLGMNDAGRRQRQRWAEEAKSSEPDDVAASSASSAEREKLKRVLGGRRSWLTRTRYFQRAIDASFDKIDVDGSGDVTLDELYAGLLLIHLQMAAYVGASACKPASKSYVAEIFHLLDKDHSGVLTREEFSSVMKILYSQVFTRIVIQWSLTLMVVPVVSQFIIEYATALLSWMAREFSKDVDDDSYSMQSLLWRAWRLFLSCVSRWTDGMEGAIATATDMIPSSVWRGMPLTMATAAQTSIALPYILGRVEDFFMWAAHRK